MHPDEQDSQIVAPDYDVDNYIPASPNSDLNVNAEEQSNVHNQQHEAKNGPMLGDGSNHPTKETQQDARVADTQCTGLEVVSFQSTEADAQASVIDQNSLISRVGDTQFISIEAETQALHGSPQVGELSPTSQEALAQAHASTLVEAPVVNNGSFIVVNRSESHVDDPAAGFRYAQAKKHIGENFSRPPGNKKDNNNTKSELSNRLRQPPALPSNGKGVFSIFKSLRPLIWLSFGGSEHNSRGYCYS